MAIEYLNPTDQYNIDVFNRNFQAVEDAVNGVRPLDWIELPDISKETSPTFVGLLHIPPLGMSNVGFMIANNSGDTGAVKAYFDWGDGSDIEEVVWTADEANNNVVTHSYRYYQINAPLNVSGEKQVVVRIFCDKSAPSTWWDYIYSPYSRNMSGVTNTFNTLLLREASVQAGSMDLVEANFASVYAMRKFTGYNLDKITMTAARQLTSFNIYGEKLRYLSTSQFAGRKLNIPIDNPYTTVTITSSAIREIEFNDLSHLTSSLSYSALLNLSRLHAGGLNRGCTISSCPSLSREGIVEFFESLGQADMSLTETNRTIKFSGTPGARDLTDADKKIATDKGFLVTVS